MFIQGEYENPFIVGYQESIRHRFTPFTIVLLFLFVLFLACLFVCLFFLYFWLKVKVNSSNLELFINREITIWKLKLDLHSGNYAINQMYFYDALFSVY